MQSSERITKLGTEGAFAVLAKAKAMEAEGRSIIHLQIGEPDFETPKNISEVKAEIPLAETFGYATVLRSLTQGRANHTLSFDRYQALPRTIADKLLSKLQCA